MSESSQLPPTVNAQLAGYWSGNYFSKDKIPLTKVQLTFLQMSIEGFLTTPYGKDADVSEYPPGADALVGTYMTHTGAMGWSVGYILGNQFSMSSTNVFPSCPGNYAMQDGQVSGNQITWNFVGTDCLGDENGSGEATLTFQFPETRI